MSVVAYFKLSVSDLWYGNVIWRNNVTSYQVQQSRVKYSFSFQTADWKVKMGCHVIFCSRKLYDFIEKYEITNIEVGKKYNILNIFWHNISTTQAGWGCFWTNAAKTQNCRLEQDEVKLHWGVFILFNNRNLCKNKPQCKIQAFLLKSLVTSSKIWRKLPFTGN